MHLQSDICIFTDTFSIWWRSHCLSDRPCIFAFTRPPWTFTLGQDNCPLSGDYTGASTHFVEHKKVSLLGVKNGNRHNFFVIPVRVLWDRVYLFTVKRQVFSRFQSSDRCGIVIAPCSVAWRSDHFGNTLWAVYFVYYQVNYDNELCIRFEYLSIYTLIINYLGSIFVRMLDLCV